jgi:WD40 repeat protein
MHKLHVAESIFTNHKVVTCLDSQSSQYALGGHEDGTVRLYDLRIGGGIKQHKAFESSSSYTSQVRFSPVNANLFASSSYDGRLRLWDLRKEAEPLFVLKRKESDFKLFALAWSSNGTQLVSGGSDSNITMYTI